MDQLTGTIKNFAPHRGFRPALELQVEISNPNEDEQVGFTWMSARVAISFSPNTNAMPSRGEARDLGIAVPKYTLPQFRKTTTTNFTLPLDDRLITDLEGARKGTNVVVYLSVTFSAIVNNPRTPAGPSQLPVSGAIADPSYGGQDMVRVVPKSQWEEIIQGLHIADIDSSRKLEEYEVQGKQKLEELEGTLEAAKEAAALVGIVEHARFFEKEALSHKRSAYWWLFFTILLAVIAGASAGFNFLKTEQLIAHAVAQKTSAENSRFADAKPEGLVGLEIQLTIAKVIILSILLSAAIWAGRVYKAHRHNCVINRHRSNALSTFQTFATGTSDPQIKNAVLLQATTCIFGPQNPGYVIQEKESETYPQILEIIRGVGNTGKPE
jgi:hypothetical protein